MLVIHQIHARLTNFFFYFLGLIEHYATVSISVFF